jgi:hypothetical protein
MTAHSAAHRPFLIIEQMVVAFTVFYNPKVHNRVQNILPNPLPD